MIKSVTTGAKTSVQVGREEGTPNGRKKLTNMFDIERDPFEVPAGGEELQTHDEACDSIIYGYATAWAYLRAIADRLSVLACEGRLTDADRDRIHDHVREVFGGLDRLYGQGCDQLAVGCDEDGYYCRTYSDGSPACTSSNRLSA